MTGHRSGHLFSRGLILGALLAAATGLSACSDADNLFESGSAPSLRAQSQANPRQQARARSTRCDSVADDRAWLNCYYGAVQPVRAELGLPPAPQSQQVLVPAP